MLRLSALMLAGLLAAPVDTHALGGSGAPAQNAPAQGTKAAPAKPAQTTRTYRNPVYDSNFPDPFILNVKGTYYAYATNSGGNDVQLATSKDLVNWTYRGEALGNLPAWAREGLTWAPEVMFNGKQYVMYYTTRDTTTERQCISVATAAKPEGPFRDTSKKPLVCQAELGGSIDASPFTDTDGKRYLLWKNDGNCCNMPTNLYIQPLTPDGLALTGKATTLIHNFELWEGNVIEAPTLHKEGGVYYLLYSAGPFDSDLYAVGYATAKSITGPYKKHTENPFLFTKGPISGPGHQAVFKDTKGRTWLAYHAWKTGLIGDQVGQRALYIDPIEFRNGKVIFKGPTSTPQPLTSAGK